MECKIFHNALARKQRLYILYCIITWKETENNTFIFLVNHSELLVCVLTKFLHAPLPSPELSGLPFSNLVHVHPFRHTRWYVPSWPFTWGWFIPRAHFGPQSWAGPIPRLCSQYDGTKSWTRDTERTSRHAGPGTKWLLSGQHVSYAQGTVYQLLTSVFDSVQETLAVSIFIRPSSYTKSFNEIPVAQELTSFGF